MCCVSSCILRVVQGNFAPLFQERQRPRRWTKLSFLSGFYAPCPRFSGREKEDALRIETWQDLFASGKKSPFPLPFLCNPPRSSAVVLFKKSPPLSPPLPEESRILGKVGSRGWGVDTQKRARPNPPLARMGRLTPNNFFLLRFPRLPPTDPMARGKKVPFHLYFAPRRSHSRAELRPLGPTEKSIS